MSQFAVFFSFKGGVGRSSTLINAARALAKKGKDVVVIDLDIAAPGLDIFEGTDLKLTKKELELKEEGYKPSKGNENTPLTKGVTEYMLKGIEQIKRKESLQFPPMVNKKKTDESYVYRFYKIHKDEDKKEFYRESDKTEGKMYIFRAGLHENKEYFDDQRELDGTIGTINDDINRYLSSGSENGKTEGVKKSEYEGERYLDMLENFKKEIDEQLTPDYVLIDARPGLSSISVMALQKLAEVVVLCFNLNPWNFEAIRDVYKNLTDEWKKKKYIASELQKILLVITPIPRYAFQYQSYKDQKKKIQVDMEYAINSGGDKEHQPIEVPYNEQMTLKDSLIADDDEFEDDATYHAYEKLADMLIRINPDDIENKLRKAKEGKKVEDTIAELERLSKGNIGKKDKVQVLHKYGEFLLGIGRYNKATEPLELAIDESKYMSNLERGEDIVEYTGNSEIYYLLGLAYLNRSQNIKDLQSTQKLFEDAKKWGKQEDLTGVAQGDSLFEEARIVEGDSEKIKKLEKARGKYNNAIKANDAEAEYHFKLGKANATIARELGDHENVLKYRNEANNNFNDAIARRNDYAEAYFNWGRNLYYESDFLKDRYKDKKLEEANDKFKKAIEYRRDYAESFYLWALSTSKMSSGSIEKINEIIDEAKETGESAEIEALIASHKVRSAVEKELKERADILDGACVDFGRGTTYKKDFKEAYFFWGGVLFILHRQKVLLEEEEEEKLYFRDAFYKLEQAISLYFDNPGFYFDPNEIDEIENNTYTCIYTLESMFNRNETYNKVKEYAGIPGDFESLFEPQFKRWLNQDELDNLERTEKEYTEYYEKLILKAVFKKFMTKHEKKKFEDLEKALKAKSMKEMLEFIKIIAERDIPGVPAWKNRKD